MTGLTLMALPSSSQAQEIVGKQVVCTESWLTIVTVVVTIVGTLFYILRQIQKLNWLRGYRFETTTKLYLMLTKGEFFVPLKIATIQAPAFTLKEINPLRKSQISSYHC